jgi:hypothetical protein
MLTVSHVVDEASLVSVSHPDQKSPQSREP